MADSAPKKKGGKGKKIVLIVLPLFILLGAGFGFAVWKGMIPGLGPKKPAPVAAKEKPKASAPAPKPKPKALQTVVKNISPKPLDLAAGASKLAKSWNEVDTPKLIEITKKWTTDDLARVLGAMDTGKVAEILSQLPPQRASDLSRAIQKLASQPEDDEA